MHDNLSPIQFPVDRFSEVHSRDYGMPLNEVAPHLKAADAENSPDRLNRVRGSIQRQGIVNPVHMLEPHPGTGVKRLTLVDGHHRAVTAMEEGHETVPAYVHQAQQGRGGYWGYPTHGKTPRLPTDDEEEHR